MISVTFLYVTKVSKSLMTLQSLYGPFIRVYAKGTWACHVCDTVKRMIRMVDRGFTSQPSQIDAVVLLDRRVDLITPLVTPLTYEGLVDELFGINYTVTQLPADRFPEDEGKGCLLFVLFTIAIYSFLYFYFNHIHLFVYLSGEIFLQLFTCLLVIV